MIASIRDQYNASFTEQKYQNFLDEIAALHNHRPPFRISETPVFVNDDLQKKIFQACEDITAIIAAPDFKEKTQQYILPQFDTPNEGEHNLFLQYDFGICQLEDGTLVPKLIELQGFPTLYFYQDLVARMYRKHFNLPENYSHLFNGLDSASYKALLRDVIVGKDDPRHTVLLEIEPHIQPTQIDYLCTSHEYNRVIFDELIGRKDLKREFHFKDEVDVKWIGHPNWFFRVSKSTLPLLHGEYVPKTYILSDLDKIPDDLENYVLKPLYSFSGSGVVYNVKQENIDAITDRSNFQLQEKVTYSPVVKSLDDMVKCEVRMIMIWRDGKTQPFLVNNLARMSKGKMIGVKYNKNKTWVGGSVAFFRD